MLKEVKVPLMKLEVAHSLKGRIRIRSRALKYLGKEIEHFQESLSSYKTLKNVNCSAVTGSILINYDSTIVDIDDVLEIVERQLAFFSLLIHTNEREERNAITVSERNLNEESLADISKRIITAGATLVFFLLKRSAEPVGISFIRRLFSPVSLMSIALSRNVIQSGIESLVKTKKPNADTLTMTATITALSAGKPLSALTTILLSDIAELMTAYTMEKTRNAIKGMLDTGDKEVYVVDHEGKISIKNVLELLPGEIISLQAGDKLSVDGTIVDGEAYIDQSAITGEFMPAHKKINDVVFAGTIIKTGQLRVRAEKIGDKTTVARIINMVENASSKKANIQALADRVSAKLIPLNFLLALGVYSVTKNINRSLSMMIIDYSCGLRLATTTALSAYIYNAANNGVLIKGGNYVELLAESDSLVLDKTGTVTEGKPKIVSINSFNGYSEREIVEFAAAAEEDSNHPIAQAILSRVKKYSYEVPLHEIAESFTGKGVATVIAESNARVLVGNRKLMLENSVDLNLVPSIIDSLERRGEAPLYVALDNVLIGIIGINDSLKENMKKTLNRLRNLGFDDIRILTGDLERQASAVADKLKADSYGYELLPEDKARIILEMQSNGSKVMMVGDGVNDAPALAYADIGVSIGETRTDIAMESSDVTLASDNPLLLPDAVIQARKTMGIVRQNFGLVISINSVGIVMSALGFLPVIWSSILHNSSTIFVVLNSGRLLFSDFHKGVDKR